MTIETKFKVGELIKHSFQVNTSKVHQFLLVMEVVAQVCYGGTQVFYLCRPLVLKKGSGDLLELKKDQEWESYHGIGKDMFDTGWKKYREDELSSIPPLDLETIKMAFVDQDEREWEDVRKMIGLGGN